jgi:shikimate kinase
LLQVENPLQRLQELHGVRDPLYRETAHQVIDGTRLGAGGITQFLLKEFERRCKR